MNYSDEQIIAEANKIKIDYLTRDVLAKKTTFSVPVRMGENHFYTVIYEIEKRNGLSPIMTNPKVIR
ncbi:hypothetical protein SAMN05660226_01989 [Parapedobacter luteus]|uniref:Uncharacterized protein n=1 Tax=Parapedobacter luteus TaxID=623280 RepID=A0A1T5C9R1_9SPHI|nr:hypothetical protein [Parapedobacter luteus]SKB56113.1 hypothetical protein SAMN05660226_01989 [Parapedobacter luteus]